MAVELELKLLCGEGFNWASMLRVLEEAGAVFQGDVVRTELINTYYDSKDLRLNKNKIALRIRKKGGAYIQTLKTAGESVNGIHRRGEWEWELSSNQIDPDLLQTTSAADCGIEWQKIALEPLFKTNFVRNKRVFSLNGFVFEIVHDVGCVSCPLRNINEPIDEIEVEFLRLDDTARVLPEHDVDENARQELISACLSELSSKLAEVCPLSVSDVSKAERGYALFLSLA